MLMHGNSTLQTLYLGRNAKITDMGSEALLTAVQNGSSLSSLSLPTKSDSSAPPAPALKCVLSLPRVCG